MEDGELEHLRHEAKHRKLDETCEDCRMKNLAELGDKVGQELDGYPMDEVLDFWATHLAFSLLGVENQYRSSALGDIIKHITSIVLDFEDNHESHMHNEDVIESDENGGFNEDMPPEPSNN